MSDTPDISVVAALIGEPVRARMLSALMDGRARTATELALEGRVAPSTASSHLARLTDAGLIDIRKQGRHRYYRIAEPNVAAAIEALMGISQRTTHAPKARVRPGPRDDGLRRARVCYDHLAGEAGVRLLERMCERGFIAGDDESMMLTRAGEQWCAAIGIDLVALRGKRRPLFLPCLDWSERRTHLAGALGAALLDRMSSLRFLRREKGSRKVVLSARGEAFVESLELTR
jgi:DNA-binding transcriptional ArsR family regulator